MGESNPGEKVGVGNTTQAALAESGTFTGQWEVNGYEHVIVNALADQDGTLYIDFGLVKDGSLGSAPSDDTITTTFTRTVPVYADRSVFQSLVKGPGRAFRVRFVNGSSAQTSFSLGTFYGDSLFPASSSPDGEILTTVTERERDAFAGLVVSNITATQYQILVDLSDTTNFPHDRTGRIDITNTFFSIDRDNTATGAVRIGVITRVDETNADVAFVSGVTFEKSDAQQIVRDRKYSPSQLKCEVVDGALTRIISNVSTDDITAINTGTPLASPRGSGTVTPAVGDIVAAFIRSAGSFNAGVSIMYHGEDPS